MADMFHKIWDVCTRMGMADWLFILLAVSTMAGAFLVAYLENIVHAAFALLLTLGSMAGLYIYLGADFLAAVQIMVYVGGVLVLILFGIFLTGRPVAGREKPLPVQHAALAFLTMVAVFFLLNQVIRNTEWQFAGWERGAMPYSDVQTKENMDVMQHMIPVDPPMQQFETTAVLADMLLHEYLLPFEVASIVLIGALVGAVVVSRGSVEK